MEFDVDMHFRRQLDEEDLFIPQEGLERHCQIFARYIGAVERGVACRNEVCLLHRVAPNRVSWLPPGIQTSDFCDFCPRDSSLEKLVTFRFIHGMENLSL